MSKNNIFPIVMALDKNVALKNENENLSYLSHLKYGYLNYKGLNLLKQKNWWLVYLMLEDMKTFVRVVYMEKSVDFHFLKLHGEPKLYRVGAC